MAELFDSYDKTYNAVVQSSIDFSGLSHDFFMTAKVQILRELLAARLSRKPAVDALDVGCGVGTFHPLIRGMFRRLCGVDVSDASVAEARRNNRDVEYEVYNGDILPYGDASFDLATAICVMHHVSPGNWPGFLREVRRVMRPGGLICVIEHNPFNPLTRFAVARCEFDSDAVLLRAGQTRRLLINAGLHDVDTRYFLLLPWATPIMRRVEYALRRLPFGAQFATYGAV
jgi:ubiquinone/menaquinone biosynthesis C-methylase UbiE